MRADPTLAEIVSERPSAASLLERHGLDYCCDGAAHLSEASAAVGIDPGTVAEEIAALPPEPVPDWASMDVAALVDHIVSTHHERLRGELVRCENLVVVVEESHGAEHPVVISVATTFARLHATLVTHMEFEEANLFPTLRQLSAHEPLSPADVETVMTMLRSMRDDHETASELLDELRALTGGYRVFAGADMNSRLLYEGLAAIDADTRMHVHKENNLLYPAVEMMVAGAVAQRS